MITPSTKANEIANNIRKYSQNPAFNLDICLGALFAVRHYATNKTDDYKTKPPKEWQTCESYWNETESITLQLLEK